MNKNQLKKVAVTGGLSCGKSTACRFFKELGAYVVSADEIVHQLLLPTTNLGQKVIQLIGPEIVVNNQIDRSQIAKKVFNNPKLLQSLEKLVHPAVRREMEKQYQQVNATHQYLLFIAEIPLLFETGAQDFFDYTVVVVAEEKVCKERFKKASGYKDEEYNKRMARQIPVTEKARQADFVITNNGTLEDMKESVTKIFQTLTGV